MQESTPRIAARLRANMVVAETGCWVFQIGVNGSGYGYISLKCDDGRWRSFGAHRVAWEIHSGEPVPPGMQVDHLCYNPRCINPLHLEVVTPTENNRRKRPSQRTPRRRSLIASNYCPRGHERTEANTQARTEAGRNFPHLRCRECDRVAAQRRRDRAKTAN